MDLSKFIDDNLDDLLDVDYDNKNLIDETKITSENEDLEEDIDDLYEKLYYNKLSKSTKINNKNNYNNNNENHDNSDNENYDNLNNENNDNSDNENHDNHNNIDINLMYYIHLINIFIKYYNDKYDKKDNFFSGIIDNNKDTSSLMELFFEAIIEFKTIKQKLEIEDERELLNYIIQDENDILNLFMERVKFDQIYCLELNNKKLFTPSLLVFLNYIYDNNLLNNKWNIYTL